MGSGIAQVAAQAGNEVLLNDVDEHAIQRGIRGIEKNLARAVEKGRMTDDEARQHDRAHRSAPGVAELRRRRGDRGGDGEAST